MQTAIVALVVLTALVYVGRRVWAAARPKAAAGCGDGCGCGATDGAQDWAES